MIITKRGEVTFDPIWLGYCSTCGSEGEARQSELVHRSSDEAYHECPVCHEGCNGDAKFKRGMRFIPQNLLNSPIR